MKLILETTHSFPFGGKAVNYKVFINHFSDVPEEIVRIHENDELQPTRRNDQILCHIFSDAVNIDTWKHTWHMDISKFNQLSIRDKIQKILIEKQQKRRDELKYLVEVEQVLMAYPVKEDDVTEKLESSIETDLPF